MADRQRSKRWVCAAVTAIGLTGLTAVIAMAARAPLSGSSSVDAASTRAPLAALLMLSAGCGIVALAGLAAFAWPGRRRRRDDEPEPRLEPLRVHWIWKLVAILLPFALGAVLVAAAVLGAKTVHQARSLAGGGVGVARPSGSPAAAPGAGSAFVVPSWLPWTIVAILVLAVAVASSLWSRWRQPRGDGSSEPAATRAAVAAAIAALDTAADPRDAVIAAYAAMERTLAANGVARSSAEAPREYLQRVLVASSATRQEAITLTSLFEEARFSVHPIPERVRELALSALSSLRARLKVGAD